MVLVDEVDELENSMIERIQGYWGEVIHVDRSDVAFHHVAVSLWRFMVMAFRRELPLAPPRLNNVEYNYLHERFSLSVHYSFHRPQKQFLSYPLTVDRLVDEVPGLA